MAAWLVAAVLALAASGAAAQTPLRDRDYQELKPARPVSTGERIEVIEFFYYGCPVCYEAQPHVARWLNRAGPDIAILRVPAVFTDSSESFARTFYTLGAMNQIARLHWPLYDNHHFDGKQLNVEQNVVAWITSNGVDAARFTQLWHSPEIDAQLEAAKKALATYDVSGVPTFVIDGRYLTSAKLAGSVPSMMRVVEQLVVRARAERGRQ